MPVAWRTTAPAPAVAAARRGTRVTGGRGRRLRPPPRAASPSAASSCSRPRRCPPVDEQGHDQRDAADQQGPRAGQAEPLVEGAQEASVAPTPAMIAPEIIVMPPKYVNAMRPSAAGTEPRVADRAEVVGVEGTGHARDERRDPEAGELRVADVDPGGRRGSLVRADGQHPLPEAGAPHVGDEEGEEDRRGEDEEAEHGARQVVVDAAEGARPGRG